MGKYNCVNNGNSHRQAQDPVHVQCPVRSSTDSETGEVHLKAQKLKHTNFLGGFEGV